MPIVRIEHAVPDFDRWKHAFDSDPMDRKGSGVTRYRIYRSVNEPNLIMIDLELDTLAQARALLERLQILWAGPGGAVMQNARALVVETVESQSV
ncbi:MAG TPA: hypothetical protein VM053_06495 [Gemmatimonadaceae bacterium]|nr:hypothetical protein [Gemmatimonadaceae bacterium]